METRSSTDLQFGGQLFPMEEIVNQTSDKSNIIFKHVRTVLFICDSNVLLSVIKYI